MLRLIIDDIYMQEHKGASLSEMFDRFSKDYPGELLLKPGTFLFFFSYNMYDAMVEVPFEKLKQYIRPEYRNRLMNK